MKKNNYWIIGIAIIALIVFILSQIGEYKQNKKWQEEIEKRGEKFKSDIDNATGANTSIQDIYPEVETIHVNSKEQLK